MPKIEGIPLKDEDTVVVSGIIMSNPYLFINKLILTGDKLLVTHSEVITWFGLNGKRICEIGRKGEEPEEYSRLFGLLL